MAMLGQGASNRTWILKIVADIADAKQSLGNIEDTTNRMQSRLGKFGKAVAGAFAVDKIIDFGRSAVNAASEVEQSTGAVESVFKNMSGEITNFAETTAKNLGISKSEFQELAAVTGAMLKNAGVPMQDLAGQTIDLTERAADMAATFGTTVPEAMQAINSALRGERDPIERFGVTIKQTDIDARAAAMGYVDAEGKVTSLGKSMATTALIMEQTRDIQGQNAREAGTFAGQSERLRAQFKDLQADLGEKLLPVMVKFFEILRPIIEFIAANIDWLAPLAGILLGVAAAMWVVNAALAANPVVLIVGAIILAIGLLVIAIQQLIKHWDTISKAMVDAFNWVLGVVKSTFNWIKDNWPLLLAIITGPIGLAVKFIVDNWDAIKRGAAQVIESLRYWFGQVWDVMTWPFRRAWDTIKYVVDQLKGVFTGFLDALRWVFGQIYDIVTYPFRRAVEAIKWLWNSTLGGFGFSVPSWVPLVGGREFRIPEMASGGIVNRPTIAMIGESGPEAVIPLDRLTGGGGNTYYITVNALRADAETGRLIHESLVSYEKSSGNRR